MTTARQIDGSSAEVERLRRTMNDVLSLLALPAMWAGSAPTEIVVTLTEALRAMLDLDGVYVGTAPTGDSPAIEASFLATWLNTSKEPCNLSAWLSDLCGTQRASWPEVVPARIGAHEVTLSVTHLGWDGGVIVTASDRPNFPSAFDRLLLNVAGNQATVALHEARLRDEQQRIAKRLDQRVAERTAALSHVNAALEKEIAARREVEASLQLTIDSLPALAWAARPDGAAEFFNKNYLEYVGRPLEEMRGWKWTDVVHPDDVRTVASAWEEFSSAGRGGEVEARLRRRDGTYRWFLLRANPQRDTHGRIVKWHGVNADIEDRKRAETLLAGEKRLLEMIASGESLRAVLESLCLVVERAAPDCFCDFHTIDWTGPVIDRSIAPSLPRSYTDPIAGTPLRPEVVPCGIAARDRVQVVSEDFAADPRWCTAAVRTHVVDHGLRAVWSTPVCSKSGNVLATLCIYQRQAGVPQPHHQDIIGRATHIASIAIERLRAEEDLRRSQASLADAQHISLTGSFSWFIDGDVYAFSDQLTRIFEVDAGPECTFEQLAARVHADDLAVVVNSRAVVREGRDNPDYECRLRMPDGRVKHVRVIGRTLRHSDGRLECIGAVQDVTAQRQAEDTLNKVRSDLAHLTRVMSLGTLAAAITHEVNQPLSGIVTNAHTCQRMLSSDPPRIDGALESTQRMIRDANRATDVLARLRPLFRKENPPSESVDVHRAAREVIALSQLELQRHRISLVTAFAEGVPVVSGDRVQLQQVMLNLLLNAADAVKEVEGRERQISMRTSVEAAAVTLAVSDNGSGFDPDQASKMFDAFFTTKGQGMGIGLSVSRSIIERHGGRLWAETNDDGGATFRFSLPRPGGVP